MPWKDSSVMHERLKFIARLRDGEEMSELCREFGISRKTGHKFQRRYLTEGPAGLYDHGRRPERLARATDPKLVALLVKAREKRPTWGAGKIIASLKREHPKLAFPVRSTVHAIFERHGLVKKSRRRTGYKAEGTSLTQSSAPNDLWAADYKGQFRLGDRSYCYPLTISDDYSRYLLACDGHESTKGLDAFATFQAVFEEYGLPAGIRTDNGTPFASRALFGLSQLSVWWMRLGIKVERIEPGNPQQNGRHERIHRTMKGETVVTQPAPTILQQQDALEIFREDYNERRPHAALADRMPADLYQRSKRKYSVTLSDPDYSDMDQLRTVTKCGRLFVEKSRESVFLSAALGQQPVGIKEEDDDLWAIRFMDLNLGYYDRHEGVFHRGDH
jgi:transposase InsO family protein